MSRLARLFTSVSVLAALVLGLFATNAFKAQPAYAGNFSCSGNVVQVVCVDGPITVTLKDIEILNGNDISVVLVQIQNSLNNINILSDITTVIKIHDVLSNIGIKVCEIKIQIGLIAVNKVFC